ncbi:hypothetical protein E4U14_000769 [Claviceps sp. LM454 group G7]|nr:hypothetical protein E4U14_000769 [Claviceps sp. LM454 group G7]
MTNWSSEMANRFVGSKYLRHFGEGGTGFENEDGIVDEASDLQAGYGTHVTGMIYTRELQQGLGGTALAWEQFREVSTKWRQAAQIAAHKTKHG